MPFIVASCEDLVGKKWGTGDCPALVQASIGVPHTSFWEAGLHIAYGYTPDTWVSPPPIALDEFAPSGDRMHLHPVYPGTVIATFFRDKGVLKYPSAKSGNHVAVYYSHDEQTVADGKGGYSTKKGIWVIDQWKGKKAAYRFLDFAADWMTLGVANVGYWFSVVEDKREPGVTYMRRIGQMTGGEMASGPWLPGPPRGSPPT